MESRTELIGGEVVAHVIVLELECLQAIRSRPHFLHPSRR